MLSLRRLSLPILILPVLLLGFAPPLRAAVYRIESARSKIEVLVVRGGLFGFLGRDHEILSWKLAGTVRYNPAAATPLDVDASLPADSLTVVDPEAPMTERNEVQANLRGERVLDVTRYPEIRFTSTGAVPARTPSQLLLTGDLALHGTVKRISFPVRITPSAGALLAVGMAKVRQTDFGITPIRFAGGTVTLRDQVEIHFTVLARESPPAGP